MATTIWHNPRCSKSREALSILQEKGIKHEVYKYLEAGPSAEDIKALLAALGLKARDLIRTSEPIYTELNLDAIEEEIVLIAAMAKHPKLIERPIIVKDGKAVIGRPPERILDII